MKFLIVNADDLGMTPGINAGVVEAHQRGVVTSASLMVKQPAAEETATMAADNPRLSLGLHIDLAETEHGRKVYERVDLDDVVGVAREIDAQLALFVSMVGREPDHLDSHQHVHLEGAVRAESLRVAARLRVPLRGLHPRMYFCSDFYGLQDEEQPDPEALTLSHLLELVEQMPDGWTELMCHPGHSHDVRSVYARERETELAVICDPSLREELRARGVELRAFSEFHG